MLTSLNFAAYMDFRKFPFGHFAALTSQSLSSLYLLDFWVLRTVNVMKAHGTAECTLTLVKSDNVLINSGMTYRIFRPLFRHHAFVRQAQKDQYENKCSCTFEEITAEVILKPGIVP